MPWKHPHDNNPTIEEIIASKQTVPPYLPPPMPIVNTTPVRKKSSTADDYDRAMKGI